MLGYSEVQKPWLQSQVSPKKVPSPFPMPCEAKTLKRAKNPSLPALSPPPQLTSWEKECLLHTALVWQPSPRQKIFLSVPRPQKAAMMEEHDTSTLLPDRKLGAVHKVTISKHRTLG